MNTASIVVDASRYIEELKERVERLDQDVVTLQNSNEENSLTAVYFSFSKLRLFFYYCFSDFAFTFFHNSVDQKS